MKNFLKKIIRGFGDIFTESLQNRTRNVRTELIVTKDILIQNYIQKNLFENPNYVHPKKLTKYEFQVYSQNGEDGIIQEIFTRIGGGTADSFFVEFGVENGLECNSLFLLVKGWKGCWLDGSKENVDMIKNKFDFLIHENKLSARQAFITAENIEELFRSMAVPKEFDLLSIDIDGNDYWVWKAIKNYSPKVLIIEYNAIFPPPTEFIVKYQADKVYYPHTTHFGASLKSMELLGSKKGYKLVGCNFNGTNAFFVREDLVKDNFLEPFTAETHYESPKYFLLNKIGHERDFGRFVKDI